MSANASSVQAEYLIEWLPPDLYGILRPQYEAWGRPVPDPAESSVAIAIDQSTGNLAGFWVLQRVIHAEPLWLSDEHRENGLWRLLADKIQEPFRAVPGSGFYVFAPDTRIAAMCEKSDMKPLDWKIYSKEF